MEYISTSKQEVTILKDARDREEEFIRVTADGVVAHSKIYNELVPWSEKITFATNDIDAPQMHMPSFCREHLIR